MEEFIPDKLYKYRPWNDFTKEIILENKLYFQSAEKFNDPFDCCIFPNMEGTNEEWIKFATDAMAISTVEKLPSQLEVEIRSRLLKMEHHKIKEMFEEHFTKNARNKMGVYCFSACKDSILMWSHYADNHRGVCFEFDCIELGEVTKVRYSKEYPKINFRKPNAMKNNSRYSTKAKEWEYESEYRLLRPNFVDKKSEIEPKILKGIICGCSMPNKDVEELIIILNDRLTPITLYRAEKKKDEFGLGIVPIGQYGKSK